MSELCIISAKTSESPHKT